MHAKTLRHAARAALCVVAVAPWARPALAQTEPHALDLSARDTTCQPCKDFYQYANGHWLATQHIPASYASWGSFNSLADRNQEVLHQILDQAAGDLEAKAGSDTWKLGAFYGTCMDSAEADRMGWKPIEPALARIAGLTSVSQITDEVARLQLTGVRVLFGFRGAPDARNSSQVIGQAFQGGLTLPDRDYYTREDPKSMALRAAYRAHVAKCFTMVGETADRAAADADRVIGIETSLAKAAITRVERRDPHKTYHKMPVSGLVELAPAFGWNAYFAAGGLSDMKELNVAEPDFFKALNGMLESVPLADWKAYLRWHVIDDAAPVLSQEFVDEDFAFSSHLTGAKEQQPRWKRCLSATNRALGEMLGREYVKRNFPPEAKTRALEMVHNLEAALKDRLETLPWMGDSTRAQALAKLGAIEERIGYPDKWRDYSKLEVDRGSFFANRERATEFEVQRQLAKIDKPVDRTEWGMTPPTVNAYYSSALNSINFPAGILQWPFFDPKADDAVNYGGIGGVIGHEMTHGFDDHGRQFDAKGNLRDWWTPTDAAAYKERAEKVVAQFDGYVAVDTLHVNGRLTLGENIADLGGLAIAYAAFEKSQQGKPRKLIDGLTPEQRFFLSWAQVWRQLQRPENLRRRVLTDPHSPGKWRVDGPMSNLPEFARAWGCKQGDPMVRPKDEEARIW